MVFIGYQVKDSHGGLTKSAICIKMNEIPQVLEGIKKINQLFLELIKKKDEPLDIEEEIDFTEKKAGFKVVARVNHNFEIILYRAWRPIEAPGNKLKSTTYYLCNVSVIKRFFQSCSSFCQTNWARIFTNKWKWFNLKVILIYFTI